MLTLCRAVGNRVQRLRRADGTALGSELNHSLGGHLTEDLPAINCISQDSI